MDFKISSQKCSLYDPVSNMAVRAKNREKNPLSDFSWTSASIAQTVLFHCVKALKPQVSDIGPNHYALMALFFLFKVLLKGEKVMVLVIVFDNV